MKSLHRIFYSLSGCLLFAVRYCFPHFFFTVVPSRELTNESVRAVVRMEKFFPRLEKICRSGMTLFLEEIRKIVKREK